MLLRRREPVPFAFLAEADRFRSNVTPPPRQRASAGEVAGRWLTGLTIVAGLVGSLVLGICGAVPGSGALTEPAVAGLPGALTLPAALMAWEVPLWAP